MDKAEYDLKSYGGWGGCHPLRPINLRWIAPSKMSIIPHVTQKPNPIIVLTFVFKNKLKHYLSVFLVRSGEKGVFSSGDILQIADVVCWVVFLVLFLCFWAEVWLFLLHKTCKMYRRFVMLYQNNRTSFPRFLSYHPFFGY